ncbi:MAG: hypothetical protein N2449_09135, partial [Bacteroidales bacterium]|nr:hypothetical protein [Bacteroidales bacterium]
MNKIILVILGIFLFTGVYSQQVLQLYNTQDNLLSNGDTIIVSGTPQTSELIAHVKVKNITSNTLEVTCRKWVLNSVQGTNNVFCWANLCYPPNVLESQVMYIQANTVVNDFSGHFYPNGISAVSVVMYTFDPRGGDTAWIYVKYDATGQSVKPNQLSQLNKPYPNPASKEVYISYSLNKPQNAVLEVYDIIGKRQYTQA